MSGAILYLVFEGNQELTTAEERQAVALCLAHGGKELPRSDAEQFWRDRHEIARRFARNRRQRRERGRDGIYRDWIHVALPSSKVLAFRNAAQEIVERHGVRLQESGLWVQPELFSMRLGAEDGAVANAQLALEEAIEELLRLVQQIGGSMEYTHGVGVKLAPLMAEEHGYGLQVMRQIKKLLDPNSIINPGKMGLYLTFLSLDQCLLSTPGIACADLLNVRIFVRWLSCLPLSVARVPMKNIAHAVSRWSVYSLVVPPRRTRDAAR